MNPSKKKIGRRTLGVLIVLVVVMAVAGVAFAAVSTPSQILAGLTGRTEAELQAEREAGATYGSIAAKAGVLEAFQEQKIAAQKARLEERVADGSLTRESADAIAARIQERVEACDGTGAAAGGMQRIGRGSGNGMGTGRGMGRGAGGGGMGRGGVCTVVPAPTN